MNRHRRLTDAERAKAAADAAEQVRRTLDSHAKRRRSNRKQH